MRWLALALGLGALGGLVVPTPALVLSATVLCVVAALARECRDRVPRRTRLSMLVAAVALAAGALRGATATPAPAPEDLRETPVVLLGTLDEAPRIVRDAAGGRLAIARMRIADGARRASLRIRLARGQADPDLLAGDTLRVSGRCTAPRAPANPGERDRRAGLRREGIVLHLSAPNGDAVRREPALRARSALTMARRLGAHLRREMLRGLAEATGDRHRAYSVLAALLVGERAALPDEVSNDFRRAGAAHLLAVSGLHVVLLVGSITALLDRLVARVGPGRGARWAVLAASLAFVAAYAATCRLATPVVRASVFVAVALVARRLGRRTGTLDHLAIAAALVVAASPAEVLRPGFHLSFSAVLGLCVLTPRFREALFSSWDLLAHFPEALPAWRLRAHAWLAAGVSASLAAATATAPVSAAVFGELHVIAPLSNLIAVPLVGVLLPTAALAALVGGAGEPLLGPLLGAGVSTLTTCLGALAATPGATLSAGAPPPWAVVGGVLLLCGGALVRPWRRRHLMIPFACWALLATAPRPRADPPPHDLPSLVALDVGHGVAVLVRGGQGGAVLYDAGGRMPGTAEKIVVPALRALGVQKLAALAISHEDSDHCGAVPDLLARVPVGVVLVPPGFGGAAAGRRVLRACARRSVPVLALGRGDSWNVRDVRLQALHPRVGTPGPAENDGSLVLHATLGDTPQTELTALLPGDVEESELLALARDPTIPAAEILLLPHHGRGPPELQTALARRCGARVLIASTPETAPTAVPGALMTGHEGAFLVRRGRAPLRLRR